MDRTDREADPQFTQPYRQVILMLLVLGLTGAGTVLALPRVLPVFEANPYLNGFILFVFVIGVLACFWQVWQLIGSVRWIESFARGGRSTHTPPRLLAPLAALLGQRGRSTMTISQSSQRSILDSIAQRIDEVREITRYIVSLLIFLGLLGTFYGLATTVPALVDTIRSLSPEEGETGAQVFQRLQVGLESQLGGMGVAFASSLLGLAGSLVVGLLELFAGHGQNRFYRELEEWLSSITRLGFASGDSDENSSADHQFMVAVVDHLGEQMEGIQQMFTASDVSRSMVDEKIGKLADAVERMTERLEAQEPASTALARLAEGQERLLETLENGVGGGGIDAESRMRLRSIDVQMLRILEEISAGRQETMAELRTDISALSRALQQGQQRARAERPMSLRGPEQER
ncbi:biopolymer transporter ExbB [Primorskyibacter sp. S187A]|uniref:biopolymer transporter ExbB n=1 Tax=Primorskyibacter sp. S187A TaxID=3415130 RepID=UPI003C7CC632